MSRADWESKAGQPIGNESFFVIYANGYHIALAGDRLEDIELRWKPSVSMGDARAISKSLMPRDAVFVKSYFNNGHTDETVDVYSSKSLAKRFESQWWFDAAPGTFIVIYNESQGSVTSIIVATGNNP